MHLYIYIRYIFIHIYTTSDFARVTLQIYIYILLNNSSLRSCTVPVRGRKYPHTIYSISLLYLYLVTLSL